MKDLTCIYGPRLLSVALSRIFVLFTLVCIVVMFSALHGLKIQAKFFFGLGHGLDLRWRGPWS